MTPTDVTSALKQLLQWHQDMTRALSDRQLWAAAAGVLGILITQFTGLHVSPTVLETWIGTMVGLMLASGIAQHGHATAAADAARGLDGSMASSMVTETVERLTTALEHLVGGAPAAAPPSPPAPPAAS
jgi:hypothetical protein